jgi:hypothetical protein
LIQSSSEQGVAGESAAEAPASEALDLPARADVASLAGRLDRLRRMGGRFAGVRPSPQLAALMACAGIPEPA